MTTDFEQWLQTTPEYKNLLIQHGERLFIIRDGEYEILTVRLAYRAYGQSRQQPVNHCNHYFVNCAKTLNKTQCIKCGVITECDHQWKISAKHMMKHACVKCGEVADT